jgi:hypothetical protein
LGLRIRSGAIRKPVDAPPPQSSTGDGHDGGSGLGDQPFSPGISGPSAWTFPPPALRACQTTPKYSQGDEETGRREKWNDLEEPSLSPRLSVSL